MALSSATHHQLVASIERSTHHRCPVQQARNQGTDKLINYKIKEVLREEMTARKLTATKRRNRIDFCSAYMESCVVRQWVSGTSVAVTYH
jgi:hypothetical protein